MIRKKRHRHNNPGGAQAKRKKLTQEQVDAIRAEYFKGGTSTHKLAKTYGVSANGVKAIVAGKTWKEKWRVAS